MSATNTPTTLQSRLKDVYAQGPSQIVPAANELFGKRLEFRKDLEHGKKTVFDIQLSNEQGFTTGQGEVTLNGAVAQVSESAEVQGFTLILQSRLSYDAISRAKDSKKAFVSFNSGKYVPAAESYRTRGELICMGYGRQGIGVVTDNTSGVLTISPASWCSAMLLTLKGATITAFDAVDGSTQHNGDLVISAISIANKTITVTGTNSAVVADDILFLKGHHAGGAYGLMDIAKNVGELYNIDADDHELWKANHFDVGTSAVTLGKISLASAQPADKGCKEKLTCLVPNKAFQSMVNDQAAMRDYGANYNKSKAENGFESIDFWGASGKIEIIPYMFTKEGEFIMFPERYSYLLGSEEMTNQVGQTGDIYFDLESTSAKEMRFYGDWTVFCERPGYMVYGTRSDGLALHT